MSRILRRPMFRGGSTGEGIMSVPRKGYADPDEDGVQSDNTSSKYTTAIDKTLAKDLLVGRPDPLGKFLINFGLNYMSARPRSGRFGALTTAADAAKKPTEQLYADIDADRLFKLKLYTAMSKKESAGAFEKRVKAEFKYDQELPEGERRFKTISDAARYVSRLDAQKKQETVGERIAKTAQNLASKSISTDASNLNIIKNQAEIIERDKYKLGKDIEKYANINTFAITDQLQQKPNSTDFTYPNASSGILKQFKTGRIYVDSDSRMSFEYMGNNIFRPKMKL